MTLIFYSVVYMIKRPSTVDEKVADIGGAYGHQKIQKYKRRRIKQHYFSHVCVTSDKVIFFLP